MVIPLVIQWFINGYPWLSLVIFGYQWLWLVISGSTLVNLGCIIGYRWVYHWFLVGYHFVIIGSPRLYHWSYCWLSLIINGYHCYYWPVHGYHW